MNYWNECIELIKLNVDKDVKSFDGTVRLDIINDWSKSPLIYKIYQEYVQNFKVFDPMMFVSLLASNSVGAHDDPDNVIIFVLDGNITYEFPKDNKKISMKKHESIFIPKDTIHNPIANNIPRMCLSMATSSYLKKEDATYHYNYI